MLDKCALHKSFLFYINFIQYKIFCIKNGPFKYLSKVCIEFLMYASVNLTQCDCVI